MHLFQVFNDRRDVLVLLDQFIEQAAYGHPGNVSLEVADLVPHLARLLGHGAHDLLQPLRELRNFIVESILVVIGKLFELLDAKCFTVLDRDECNARWCLDDTDLEFPGFLLDLLEGLFL